MDIRIRPDYPARLLGYMLDLVQLELPYHSTARRCEEVKCHHCVLRFVRLDGSVVGLSTYQQPSPRAARGWQIKEQIDVWRMWLD